jgi:hypothetical protein
MSVKRSLLIILSIVASIDAVAQRRTQKTDSLLNGATIEVIQSYKPELRKAEKPVLSPSLPPADTTRPIFKYEVPQQTLTYSYNSVPLRPLALGLDSANKEFANYLKIGGGNYATFLAEAGIGSLRGDNYETSIQLHHLSQKGNEIDDQIVSRTGIDATGAYHTSRNVWNAGVQAFRNRYSYYGYNHDIYAPNPDSVKQVYTGLRLTLGVKNEVEELGGFSYHPTFSFSSYSDRFDASERTFALSLPLSYALDTSLKLHFGAQAFLTQYNAGLRETGNNLFQITPAVSVHTGNFDGYAGVYPTFAKGNKTYILPDVRANYRLPATQATLFAGWEGQVRRNTFEELSTKNPFMYDTFTVQQTRVNDVYAGIKTNIGTHFSVNGRAGWIKYSDLPLFINDTSGDMKQFAMVYDKQVEAFTFQAGARYQVADIFSIGLGADLYNFMTKTYKHVWHEPAIKLNADIMAKPVEELIIKGYVSIMDEIYAVKKGNAAEKLNAIADIGVGGEYSIIPRLSAFLQINNILNNKYQRWYGYNSFGLNAYGGIRLKF